MIKGVKDYQGWKLGKLAKPSLAAAYLNEASKDSPAMLLKAIKNVAQAREVSAVAKEAGIARENLYRAFSEQGNPTYDTLLSVLNVLGIRLNFVPAEEEASPMPSNPPPTRQVGLGEMRGSIHLGSHVGGSHEKVTSGLFIAYGSSRLPKLASAGVTWNDKLYGATHGR